MRGWLCPWIAGPQVQTKSISSRPSAVVSMAPCADFVKNGAPPTERKARTGELTPPGMSCWARAKRDSEAEGMKIGPMSPIGPMGPIKKSSAHVFLYDRDAPAHAEGEGSDLQAGGGLLALV